MNLVLKVSGEVLNNNDLKNAKKELASFIKALVERGHHVAIVIGGGNLFRGRDHKDMAEVNRDTIGMLSSLINAFHIHDELGKMNVNSLISCPFNLNNLIPIYSNDKLIELFKDNVLIFGGGLGKTGISTDTKCFEVAKLLGIDTITKLTNVSGVYDKDPKLNNDARLLKKVSYDTVINQHLNIFDLGVIEACKLSNIKIRVLNYQDKEEIFNMEVGSVITNE